MSSPFRRAFAFVLVAMTILAAACSSHSDGVQLALLNSGCLIDSDCQTPLVCAFKTCHEQCSTDDGSSSLDCPNNELCVASDRPFHVCEAIQQCQLNSECPSPLVCGRDQECRDECATARDCVSGENCIDGTCAAPNDPHVVDGGLVPPDAGTSTPVTEGAACAYTSQCPSPLVCVSGMCAFQCLDDRDCTSGERCVQNVCVTPGSVVDAGASDAGSNLDATLDATSNDATLSDAPVDAPPDTYTLLPIPDGAPDGYFAPCNLNSDCASSLICGPRGECVYSCVTDLDCDSAKGECCASYHQCVTGSACLGSIDGDIVVDGAAAADAGPACTDNADCSDGTFCDGTGQCIGGHCTAARPACDDQDPCTTDVCDESARSCSHTAIAAVDQDHDGHYATVCGGDDCDDTNPDVYAGHAELCDFIDNNCDGRIDEGLWANGAITTIDNNGDSSLGRAPAIVRLNDGSYDLAVPTSSYMYVEHVKADFSATTSTNVSTSACAEGHYFPTIATDGVYTAEGFYRHSCDSPTAFLWEGKGDLSSPGALVLSDSSGGTSFDVVRPALAYSSSASAFQIVFADESQSGTAMNLFAAQVTMSPTDGGASYLVSNRHLLFPALTQGQIGDPSHNTVTSSSGDLTTLVQLSLSGTTAFIAWTENQTNLVRYALFDSALTSIVAGPTELTNAEDVIAQSVTHNGTTFALATTDATGKMIRLRTFDDQTGAVLATRTFTDLVASNVRITAQGPGFLMSEVQSGLLAFGYEDINLAYDVGFAEIASVGNTGGAVAAIDQKHAAIAWRTGSGDFITPLTCGP